MASLNIWEDYKYNDAITIQADLQKKLFQFCREVESDLNRMNNDIFYLKNEPPVDSSVIEKALDKMDLPSMIKSRIEEGEKNFFIEVTREVRALKFSNERLRDKHYETLNEMFHLKAQMSNLLVCLEHTGLPTRFKSDGNDFLMLIDGRWCLSTYEYFETISTHYIKIDETPTYVKKSLLEYKQELFENDKRLNEELPF